MGCGVLSTWWTHFASHLIALCWGSLIFLQFFFLAESRFAETKVGGVSANCNKINSASVRDFSPRRNYVTSSIVNIFFFFSLHINQSFIAAQSAHLFRWVRSLKSAVETKSNSRSHDVTFWSSISFHLFTIFNCTIRVLLTKFRVECIRLANSLLRLSWAHEGEIRFRNFHTHLRINNSFSSSSSCPLLCIEIHHHMCKVLNGLVIHTERRKKNI